MYEQNPAYYEYPNKHRIVEGVEYDNARKEYDKMADRGDLQRGHHRLGIADGGQNVSGNIVYTGEKSLDRNILPQIVLDYYDSTYAKKRNPHPKTIAIYEKDGIVSFGKNQLHTDTTTLQQKIHIWRKDQELRMK